MDEYNANKDALCKSTPRFSFWGNLLPDGVIPFFKPLLQYNGDNGADVDISKVLDDPNHPYDKSVYLNQGENKPVKHRTPRTNRKSVRGANHNPDHLIISDQLSTSAKEVCDHPNSYGWDIVSTREALFCDMEHKQLYPLCCQQITKNCFDLHKRTLRGGLQTRNEDVEKLRFGRSYKTTAHWKER
jgi:hypothetical protein